MIDLFASLPHYRDHLLPIWGALPGRLQGEQLWRQPPARWPRQRWVLVGSYADAVKAMPRPTIYVEHGAGQSYPGDPASAGHPSYHGGNGLGLRTVALFLAPNAQAAARWRATYPRARAEAIGCPKLDPWHSGARPHLRQPRVTIGWTWHWDCHLVPETRWALPHYEAALGPLVAAWRAQGWQVWGTGHPRAQRRLQALWGAVGAEWVPDLGDVLDSCDVLLGDNTSALYEFASVGRPVVCLNAPWYRRHVHHGLRFWDAPPGIQVDDPEQLAGAELWRQLRHPSTAAIRRAGVAAAYAATDGQATHRAVAAIIDTVEARP